MFKSVVSAIAKALLTALETVACGSAICFGFILFIDAFIPKSRPVPWTVPVGEGAIGLLFLWSGRELFRVLRGRFRKKRPAPDNAPES